MAETRYWNRVGIRLTRELAFEMESKMKAKDYSILLMNIWNRATPLMEVRM